MSEALKIGTRGSDLALAQARMVGEALAAAHADLKTVVEIVQTIGDKRPDLSLTEFGKGDDPVDKGIFTKELEIALRDGRIDIAVHSLKDVPTELSAEFELGAVLPRADVSDVLVTGKGGGIAELRPGAVVATSSVRRKRELRALRPDVEVVEIRGNVPTRLRKLAAGGAYDAILLAAAGLDRLDLIDGDRIVMEGVDLRAERLDARAFLPAAGQGAVAIEVLGSNDAARRRLAVINHPETWHRIVLERRFLELLQAGCHTPVGILTECVDGRLSAWTRVFDEADEGAPARVAEVAGPTGDSLELAQRLFDALVPES